jgi:hypothetical protein
MALSTLFGIDYDTYYCGGIGNKIRIPHGKNTVIFYTESDMLKTLADLKKDYTVDIISVFTTPISRIDYKI